MTWVSGYKATHY